jgi:hypothetical protein
MVRALLAQTSARKLELIALGKALQLGQGKRSNGYGILGMSLWGCISMQPLVRKGGN